MLCVYGINVKLYDIYTKEELNSFSRETLMAVILSM